MLWPAIIQALGTIAAASLAVVLWRLQVSRDREKMSAEQLDREGREQKLRRERVEDMMAALRADIAAELPYLRLQFTDEKIEKLRAKFIDRLRDRQPRLSGKDMPQAPVVTNFVFETLKQDFTLLPRGVIEPVVSYYRHDQRLARLAQAFSEGMYEGLADERQIEAVGYYIDLGRRTLASADAALAAIDALLPAGPKPTGPARLSPKPSDGGNYGSAHDQPPQVSQ